MKDTQCTNCFKALGVASRMSIYSYLSDNEQAPVSEIVKHVGLTQPTISYHLSEMKRNGILKSVKKGKEVLYSLNDVCPHFEEKCILTDVKFRKKIHDK